MKLHAREGTMIVWALSLSLVLGVLCATALRTVFDSFEIGFKRVTHQQNLRIIRQLQEYVDWYIKHKLINQVGVSERIFLDSKFVPAYDTTINLSVLSQGVHVVLTVRYESATFGMEYIVRKK